MSTVGDKAALERHKANILEGVPKTKWIDAD